MNPDRFPPKKIKECFRLASYFIDDERLYSDEEIAQQLGETLEWVERVRAARLIDRPTKPIVDMRYVVDPDSDPSVDFADLSAAAELEAGEIFDSSDVPTNMTYDRGFVIWPEDPDQSDDERSVDPDASPEA